MLVLMLMSMLMSHASVDLFVLSFVLPCAYAYVASENQALSLVFTSDISISKIRKDKFSCEVYEDKAERIFF